MYFVPILSSMTSASSWVTNVATFSFSPYLPPCKGPFFYHLKIHFYPPPPPPFFQIYQIVDKIFLLFSAIFAAACIPGHISDILSLQWKVTTNLFLLHEAVLPETLIELFTLYSQHLHFILNAFWFLLDDIFDNILILAIFATLKGALLSPLQNCHFTQFFF